MRRKTSSGHYIGTEFPSQRKLTLNYTKLIRKIYNRDVRLSPRQQQIAIISLPGITIDEMQLIIKSKGPKLATVLRKFISAHRAKTRKIKTKKKRR